MAAETIPSEAASKADKPDMVAPSDSPVVDGPQETPASAALSSTAQPTPNNDEETHRKAASTQDSPPESAPRQAQAAQLSSPAAPAQQAQHRPESNDAVSALQAMFPGMDSSIITEVLAAHGGNADAASMALLELNNPETASPATGHRPADTHATAAAQLQADEEYARQLMAQMEREHMQEYGRPLDSAPEQRRPASGGQAHQGNYNNLNYVPRQRNRHGQPAGGSQQQQYSQGQEGEGQQGGLGQWIGGQTGPDGRWKHQDELDQLADQFNKFADTGKKTFNSFLSKAKDKYAQTAQQRALQAQSSSQHQSSSGADSGIKIGGFKLPNIPSPWQGGTGFKPGEKPMTPEREELRSGALSPESRSSVMKDYSQSPSRPNYTDRRSSSDDDRPAIQINKALPSATQAQPIRSATSTNAPALSSPPATASPKFSSSPAHLTQQHSRSSFTSGSPAKVQMLPRQTINLFDEHEKERNSRSASPVVAGGAAGTTRLTNANSRKDNDYNDDDSDSDVEYVRNPFNDDD